MTVATLAVARSQFVVEQRIFWRNRSSVFFTFLLPLLLLAFFAPFTDPALLVPGVAALAVVSVAFQGLAIQLAMHRDQGVLQGLMTTPLRPLVMVAAKVASIAVVALAEAALVTAIGVAALGVALPVQPVLLLVSLACGVLAFAALAFAIASLLTSAEGAPALVNAIYLPMLFVSGVVHPVESLPRAVQALAQALPLLHLASPVRAAWDGTWHTEHAVHLGALMAWGAVGLAITVHRFGWSPGAGR